MPTSKLLTLAIALTLLSGCASWLYPDGAQTRHGASSSLVDFLYPRGEAPPPSPDTLPHLTLPARVGIAFVPPTRGAALSESEQLALLTRVADSFRDREFVAAIEPIPQAYLTRARGVSGMQQVARLFNLDVMALVSYDQVSQSTERDSALLYWTVVGTVVFKGNRNAVHTLVDTAVFDVRSGQLLFRAPGTHERAENSTLMDRSRDLIAMRSAGFDQATDEMIVNLDHSLEGFRARVKNAEGATTEWRPGYGGGSVSVWWLLIAASLAANRVVAARRWGHGR